MGMLGWCYLAIISVLHQPVIHEIILRWQTLSIVVIDGFWIDCRKFRSGKDM